MTDDRMIEIPAASDARQQFLARLARARKVWALYPDKAGMHDAERLRVIAVLIDLQISYVINIGLDGDGRHADHYVAYLSMLLSVAATGNRSDIYPDILDPYMLPGFRLHAVTDD